MQHRVVWPAVVLALALPVAAVAADPFADEVVSFPPGTGAGFGSDKLPGIVLGPPVGGGATQGSLDVLSLGDGGSIILAFRDSIICDGDGPDFTVFENAFHAGGIDGPLFIEVGIVGVSEDGVNFVDFPYDAQTFAGLAGQTPVYSNPSDGIDPTDPTVSGGDAFDLATVGLTRVAYVRITDPGAAIPDSGSHVPSVNQAGFDLDAIAAIHACDPATPAATATALQATSTPTVTPTATPVATTTGSAVCPAQPTPCFAGATTQSQLLIKTAKDGHVAWKAVTARLPSITDLGDPRTTTAYQLCVYDNSGGAPSLSFAANAPAGAAWKQIRHGGFRYRSAAPATGQLSSVLVHADSGKIVVVAKHPVLPVLPLDQAPQVIAQLRNDAGGCWQSAYSAPPTKNDATIFKDKTK